MAKDDFKNLGFQSEETSKPIDKVSEATEGSKGELRW